MAIESQTSPNVEDIRDILELVLKGVLPSAESVASLMCEELHGSDCSSCPVYRTAGFDQKERVCTVHGNGAKILHAIQCL